MKKAEELYPDYVDQEYFYGPGDYQPILDDIGSVALQVDDADYQGSSRVLYDENGRVGYLQFGWGSCSGCDALQGCDSMQEVQKLMDELREQVRWFESYAEALHFFQTHDWEGDYSWHEDEQKDFIIKAILYLAGKVA